MSGSATIGTRIRSSRCARRPERSCGRSRSCTTICGTTTCRRSRCCSRCTAAARSIPAVAIGTKMGHVFVLDRRDGKPLFPVEEPPVPPSDVPGEKASPTQPFPPPAFRLVPESLSADDAFGVTDSAAADCRRRIASLRYHGSLHTAVAAGDDHLAGEPRRRELVGRVDRRAPRPAHRADESPGDGRAACFRATVCTPSPAPGPTSEYGRQTGTPYAMVREDLRICTPPPWGALTAIDLNAGRVKWRVPLGSLPPLPGQGRTISEPVSGSSEPHGLGSFNLGGALLTSSGLAFIAGTTTSICARSTSRTGRSCGARRFPPPGTRCR